MKPNHSFLKKLRTLGWVEGFSTLILFFIAVPLKHLYEQPLMVRIFGPVHGGLFVALCIMLYMAITRVPITKKQAILGIVAAVIPFGPFIFDRQLHEIQTQDNS